MTDSKERGAELLEQMLGKDSADATRERWATLSPDFEEYVVRFLSGEIWTRPGLDLRTKSLVTIAALMALGRSRGLELNIRMALNNGASKEEITETLLHLAPYAGFPAAWEAIEIAARVYRESD